MINFPTAKINIGLYVTNRRNDGYHNIETVLLPVKVKDVLEIVEAEELKFFSSGSVIPGSVTNNLCVKAYELVRKDIEIPPIHIHLHKHIPIGAGLGGGSSDAAFFIKLLNTKFSLELSIKKMENYARQLGADCAFFIRNKPVFATQKGDEFDPSILTLKDYCIVLVIPPVHVSTVEAYNTIKHYTHHSQLREHILLPLKDWKKHITNVFEAPMFEKYPQIAHVKSYLYNAGALYASMSGSGSAVYGIFKNKIELPELEIENQVFYDVGL